MATADSLVADVRSWTGTNTTVLPDATGLECVNEAIRRMVRRHNFRAQQATADLSIPGGITGPVGAAPLPADFLQEIFVYTKDTAQTDPAKALVPMAKTYRPLWFNAQSPTANTDPIFPQVASPSGQTVTFEQRGYYLFAGLFVIVPTPSATITVTLDYIRVLPELAVGLTPPDQNGFTTLYPDTVRMGALREAYLFLHEWETAAAYDALFTQGVKEAIDHDNATAFAGQSPVRGK